MTRTARGNDPYETVSLAYIRASSGAYLVLSTESDEPKWIPKSLFSHISEERMLESGPIYNEESVTDDDFMQIEVKLWKLRELGWV